MNLDFSYLASLCEFESSYGDSLPWALFVFALFGGFLHCSFMCAPFVFSQVSTRLKNIPSQDMNEFTRLKNAALLPYHLGRIFTYALLGGVIAFVGGSLIYIMEDISALFIVLAGFLMVLSVSPWQNKIKFPRVNISFKKMDKITKPLFQNPTGVKGFFLGMTLGFIPCGMLYGALAAAASTGNVYEGVLAMGAFAVGTIPALTATALLGAITADALRKKMRPMAQMMTVLAGLWLCVIGVQKLI